ncbi:hypothetical protein ACIQNU_42730 [Streptomyces sp. NPDC091292]|uniref:hypothetical protein n=1 Tax=Streptomyces sp. NPDC091292 TaxID=3365991 RepID=UPI0037FE4369
MSLRTGGEVLVAAAHASGLAVQGTTVINARVVDDGDLITGGEIISGLEVALWLV